MSADHNLTVRIQEGDIKIGAGSTVYVMETGADSCIFDLDDSKHGDVTVVVGGKSFALHPGNEVMLTRSQTPDFESDNPGRFVGSRQVSIHDLPNGVKVGRADFSIPSAFTSIEGLRDLLSSTDKVERTIARQVLKNAVILDQVIPSAEPYHAQELEEHNGDMQHGDSPHRKQATDPNGKQVSQK